MADGHKTTTINHFYEKLLKLKVSNPCPSTTSSSCRTAHDEASAHVWTAQVAFPACWALHGHHTAKTAATSTRDDRLCMPYVFADAALLLRI